MGEALDVARAFYDDFLLGDYDSLVARTHPEIVTDLSRSGIPDVGVYHGRDGMIEGWRKWRGVWEHYDVELEDLIERGDQVLVLTRVGATSKGHGVNTSFTGADVVRVRDNQVIEFAIYTDRDRAREDHGF